MAEFIIENISTNMVRLTMELALSCKRITTQIAVVYCELITREILVPNFNIDGHYAMDGLIMNLFPLYGSGNY
jgi:hypothetical protein